MRREMMRAKIHRARVTRAELGYVGSVSICPDLLRRSDIRPFEQVHVLDVDNGARLVTYAMEGQPGEICLNGAAARLVQVGDLVIIVAYASYEESELDGFQPRIVHVDSHNVALAEHDAKRFATERTYVHVTSAANIDDPDC